MTKKMVSGPMTCGRGPRSGKNRPSRVIEMVASWPWINTEMELWDITACRKPVHLSGKESGHIAVWRAYGNPQIARLVIYGAMPLAGEALLSIIGRDAITLSVRHVLCGDGKGPKDGVEVARFSMCAPNRSWVGHLTASKPDTASEVFFWVELKCGHVKWFLDPEA